MTEQADHPYDAVSTEELLDTTARWQGESVDSSTPLAGLRGMDDMARAVAGAHLVGIGERLLAEHGLGSEMSSERVLEMRDASGRWTVPEQRLQVAMQRIAALSQGLPHLATRVEETLPLPTALQGAAGLLQAAEQLVGAAYAELHHEASARDTAVTSAQETTERVWQQLRQQGL